MAATAHAQDVRRDAPPPPAPAPVVTRVPELLEAAAPVYPPEALAAKIEATVKIEVDIDAAGAVVAVRVLEPVGNGFDDAAVAAARQYKFRPAEIDGKPAPITIETTIHFRLETVTVPEPTPPPAGPETSLAGTVRERGTRKKLAGVSVGIPAMGEETYTDAEGRFRFDHLPAGTHQVVTVLTGYDRGTDAVVLVESTPAEVTIYLKPTLAGTYETTVQGEREKLEVTRRNLERRELTTVPGTFGDPLRVIQNLPGLARSPWASGLLLIRGSNPNDSGVFVDGHWIPLLYHFLGGPSILNPEFLDSIDLYPGGYPARFGRYSGGIIEVNTRPTASDGFHGSAKVDLLDTGVYVRVPLTEDVTFAAAGRRSYIDAILPLVLPKPSPGDTLVVVPVYWDYQARLDVALSDRAKLTLTAFGSDDKLELLRTNAESAAAFDLDTHIGFHRFRIGYVRPISPALKLSLSQVFGLDVLRLNAGDQTSTELTNKSAGTRVRVSGDVAQGVAIDAGLDLDYRDTGYDLQIANNQDFRQLGTQVDIPPELIQRSIDVYGLGAYFELGWEVVPRLRLIPSLRFDSYLLNGKARSSFDPRMVVRWKATDDTTLKAYGGMFHEPPSPETLDNVFGNPDLGLQTALHSGIGLEQKIGNRVTLDAELYYNWRWDFATFTSDVVRRDDGTLQRLNFDNLSVGASYGLEVLLKHEVTDRFYGWISYTLSRSVVRRIPDDPLVPQPFDQTHNFIGVASWRFADGWEAGLRFRLTTGRPITPVIGASFNADTNTYAPVNGDARSARRDTFHELDVRIDKTWTFDTWQIGVYLDVINVYNAENAEATQYDYRFRQTAPVRGVPIVPTLGVKGQW